MAKWRMFFWATLALVFVLPPLIRPGRRPVIYMAPRFPKEVLSQPTDRELEKIAAFIAHQTSGDNRLGLILSGQKALIVTDQTQDMRLLQAVTKAMQRRDIKVDYVFEDRLLEETLGIKPKKSAVITREEPKWEEGWMDAWPRFLPESLRKEVQRLGGGVARINAAELTPLQEAIRRYVVELHPEYDAVVGGRPRQEYMQLAVGPKWKSLWYYTNMREAVLTAATYPTDVWRLTEDKIMQTVPWIEEVHITDPEGTDLRFSITPHEAETWAKGAYQPNHLFLYPLQGSRAVYWREGIREVVAPRSNGVVAATTSNTGVFPNLRVYIKDGLVTHVEGGGRYKEIWDGLLANQQLSSAEVPLMGRKGFLYLYECSWGANPKVVRDFNQAGGGDNGRAAVFHWGFGVEMGNPEIADYLNKNGLPNDHRLHLKTYFTTYEVKLRATNQWLKFVNKGRLYHLDDPEVRALASRYGDPDEILRERWVPDVPGINAPGSYEAYARNPVPHIERTRDLLKDGTYPHME